MSENFDDEFLDQELENILNHPAPAYGEKNYWNSRYEKETDFFEWYQPWTRINGSLRQIIKPNGIALNIGCGNSQMSCDLLKEGFSKVVSIDFSDVVINQMKSRYSSEPKLEWEVSDCTKLKFGNAIFDYVFDKGTLDTIICGETSSKTVTTYIREVSRVMKPGGFFILVSYGSPSTRKKYFEGNQNGLTVIETIPIEKTGLYGAYHHIFAIKKSE